MFDKLVESTKQKGGRRYFAITCAAYAVALLVLGVGTILTFSPVLAEEYSMTAHLAPPPPPGPPPAPVVQTPARANPVAHVFAPPKDPPIEIPRPETVTSLGNQPRVGPFVVGAPAGTGSGTDAVVFGGGRREGGDPPPPPPPPPPTPEVKPQGPNKVSEGVLAGSAIRRVKPAYPQIARAVRAAGAVQVQVTISEEGNVIGAVVLNGHPTLRAAALDAARQWVFSPTKLSNVPVKVQGVLTFNFTLE
ncbi:MAG: TonB family protein [Blastocatellia bacterium]